MPKPTFLQSVLGKPSRSYADPYAPSPWADIPERDYAPSTSRYAARANNDVYLDYEDDYSYSIREREGDAQPVPRRARSVVFAQVEAEPYNPHRFPKAVKKAQSNVALRETRVRELDRDVDGYPTRPGSSLSIGTSTGTVKKKKKKKRVEDVGDDAESVISRTSRISQARSTISTTAPSQRRQREVSTNTQDFDSTNFDQPPSFSTRHHIPSDSSSSAASSSLRPRTPAVERTPSPLVVEQKPRPRPQAVQKIVAGGVAPPTPPISEPSSSSSLGGPGTTALSEGVAELRLGETSRHGGMVSPGGTGLEKSIHIANGHSEPAPILASTIPRVEIQHEQSTDGVSTPTHLEPPVLNIQPPTPAPIADPETSPFDQVTLPRPPPNLGASLGSSSARPEYNTHLSASSVPQVLEQHQQEVQSDSGEIGSGSDEESAMQEGSAAGMRGRHKSRTSVSLPSSRPTSISASSSLSGAGLDKRSSRQSLSRYVPSQLGAQPEASQRRGSVQHSEVSFGGRSAQEGSIRSSVSGFGKGGWAVAAAASQSDRNTPVQMFLPSGANSGWGDFQAPVAAAPLRQTKFTPLPAAYQPPSFDKLVNGERSPRGSASGSQPGASQYGQLQDGHGRKEISIPPAFDRKVSAPSTYSQESDSESEDDSPRPSRSYAQEIKAEYQRQNAQPTSPTSPSPSARGMGNGTDEEHMEEPSRRYTTGPYIPPKDPRRNSLTAKMNGISQFPSNGLQRGALSQASHSEVNFEVGEDMSDDDRSTGDHGEQSYPSSPGPSRPASVFDRPMSPSPSMREREAFPRPAFLDPDVLTILPEMTPEDSERLYRPPSPSERDNMSRRKSWKPTSRAGSALGQRRDETLVDGSQSIKRAASVLGFRSYAKSEVSLRDGDEGEKRRSKSVLGFRGDKGGSQWGGSSHGDGVLMQSDGRGQERAGGYNTMILPAGAYVPSDPNRKRTSMIDARILGLPQTTMAALCLSNSAHRLPMTPLHLRGNLPSPVDFTSHIKPPSKVGRKEILVQVYAVAVDPLDIVTVEEKGKGEVGKWVPGRSFVGRCLGVGGEEKDIVRGEIVVGLLNIRKSGALAEYMLVDRRHISRAPHPTHLSLEQLALLPLYGIPATRAVRGRLTQHSRALIMDAHEGVAALICQEMSRAGVNVTALIGGGEAHHESQTRCLQHGAKGVLTGAAAAVMLGLDEEGWDLVVDTKGTQRVYDAARRMLRDGGKLISLVEPDPSLPPPIQAAAKPSGLRTLRAAFSSRRKDSKHINFEYVPPAGSGEAEVDGSGMDVRDVLEEPCMTSFRPPMPEGGVWAFEKGGEAFRGEARVTSVVRIIN